MLHHSTGSLCLFYTLNPVLFLISECLVYYDSAFLCVSWAPAAHAGDAAGTHVRPRTSALGTVAHLLAFHAVYVIAHVGTLLLHCV